MTRSRFRPPATGDAAALPAEAEGFLMAQAHMAQAHREAEALCAALPWLTTAQAEDLTRHYVNQRIDLTRQMLEATVRRAGELRREYEARYLELRGALLRRHAAWASCLLACAAGLGATVWTTAR
ncbi:hypothetical protein [Streptomyces calvus]|uniref:hypothetical protein n=1 Tax=Streptomyces calvus TaxID=67282 RepID=UPI003711211E